MISVVTQNIQKQYSKRSFRSKILLLLVTFVAVQVLLIAFFCNEALKMTVHDQVSSRALMQARAIASDPNIINDMEKSNPEGINQEVTCLTRITDANFIVIGDNKGIRITHPKEYKIGFPMQGDDNYRVLHDGKSYCSTREGSLGMAIRGKAPIVSNTGKVIGVVLLE